ncbi:MULTISPECIES: hypothetical protein [Streptomyces]|uniref:Uncharacterized protein n=1 Tax=Streptomyces doudnae TaxID=3075536 RepID=A0ABD5EHT8_9ACTN|nr:MULTISPECIES: hypothetical protein [unclassified Streptomyces]MDT0433860.1 hypothetical protein [Streptomyces sp. DSM 41981]MYQ64707.1 hypothetical protein [Streptomyces sp. SID4950]SCD84507.1 hypothetical protein GA0115242_115767 [Streptomyces sp. SolWspMP-5a-2]
MNRTGRLLCALHLATAAGLALTAVEEFRHGPLWAGFLFTAASVVPVISVVRETVIEDLLRDAALTDRRVFRAADDIVRASLDAACCERWWTSLGTDHDAACPHRVPRSSAA